MNDSYLEDQFSSYNIDNLKAKTSPEEQEPVPEKESTPPESVTSEIEETEVEPVVVENVYIESPETIANREKAAENKVKYDHLLSKFSDKEPRILKKEDVEKAVAEMEDCIASSKQLLGQDTKETLENRRQARKQRIVRRQLSDSIDAYVTAKYIGDCFVDIDKQEYYQYLDDCRYIFMTSMAARTFHANVANIFEGTTAQQSRDAIDKITASAERLALSLAGIINSFPGKEGMSALLGMMVEKGDDDVIESIGKTIRMAAKGQL